MAPTSRLRPPEETGPASPVNPSVRVIARPGLRALLLKALSRRLVMIIAPTGFGKTTALLDACAPPTRVAWVQVSARDSSLQGLAARVAGEVACLAGSPPAQSLEGLLADEVPAYVADVERMCPTKALRIVLDGVDASPVCTALGRFALRILEATPDTVGVVITGTATPAVRLEEWARIGQFSMINRERLAFTRHEVAELLQGWTEAGPEILEEAWRVTAGWPRGVAALAAAYRSAPPPGEIERSSLLWAFTEPCDDSLVSFKPMDRHLLLSLSLLPTIEPGDADLITGVTGAHERLTALADAGVFLTARGAGRYTMDERTRLVLQAVLAAERPPDRLAEEWVLAGSVLEGRGEPENALEAFLRAGAGEDVRRVVGTVGLHSLLGRDPVRLQPVVDGLASCRVPGPEGKQLAAYLAMVRGAYDPARESSLSPEQGSSAGTGNTYGPDLEDLKASLLSSGHSWPRLWEAWRLLDQGRAPEAERALRSVGEPRGFGGFHQGWASVCRARIRWCRGEYRAARAALDGMNANDGSFLALMREHLLAEIEALEGDPAAMARAIRAADLARHVGAVRILRDLTSLAALCAAWRGDVDGARVWIAHAEAEGPSSARVVHAAAMLAGTHAAFTWDSAGVDPHEWWPWTALLRGFFLLREGALDAARDVFATVAGAARAHDARHLAANTALCDAYAAHQRKDAGQAREVLRQFWEAIVLHGFRFMPVGDADLVLWAARASAAWWPERTLPTARLMVPLSATVEHLSVRAADTARLEIHTLGPLAFSGEGVPADDIWKTTRKAKRLFELLLSTPGFLVSADEAADALWPDGDPSRVRHSLQNEVSNLRRAVAALGARERLEIRSEHGFYRLYCAEDVRITDRVFESLARKGCTAETEGRHGDAHPVLLAAIQLYRGAFLEDARYEEFAVPRRQHLANLVSRCLHAMAASPCTPAEDALAWWQRALELDPLDEMAYRCVTQLCMELDRPRLARRYLEAMKTKVVEELDVPMPEWAMRLLETLDGR